jgi:hypothetical protein
MGDPWEVRVRSRDHMQDSWISQDAKPIILVRGLCTFVHSAVSALLAIYLDLQGFSLFEIGLFVRIGSPGAPDVDLHGHDQ